MIKIKPLVDNTHHSLPFSKHNRVVFPRSTYHQNALQCGLAFLRSPCCAKVVSCVQPALAMMVKIGTAKALALEVDAGRTLPAMNFVVLIPQMPNITFSHLATVSLDTNL
ncbi:hypothetical protein E2C01_085987 [Portunus trituberculatus]|uniref:Uncharacterized protein n=1 Tax=Portunus trituberculatus TaxID=210409 RepID=A0A5B7JDE3_PORTR|nr:hypothetical protein [Portunus trituberculatus]